MSARRNNLSLLQELCAYELLGIMLVTLISKSLRSQLTSELERLDSFPSASQAAEMAVFREEAAATLSQYVMFAHGAL